MLESLGSRIQIDRARDQNIFTIQYQDRDRETAEKVVNTLLETFISGAQGRRRIDSGAAERFLDAQIHDYEKRLDEAEQRLADFKRENVGLMPGERGDYYSRLQNAMATLESTRAELGLAEERRKELEQQIVGEEPVFGLLEDTTTTSGGESTADRTIAQYEARLAELRLRYTENHPDVVAVKEVLAQLRGERPNTPVDRPPAAANSLNTNPVYQQMRISLSQAEVEVATLRRKLQVDTAQVEELKSRVDTIPDVERQLAALDRDYEVTRDQYDAMVRKREELRISENVESAGDDLQFRILEPPLAPQTPIGPNRPAYLTVVFAVALGAGLFLSLAMSQLKAVVANPRELAKLTGLPVLGSVSLVLPVAERDRRRQKLILFAATSAGLVVSFALVLWLQNGGAGLIRSVFA
jgi:polysaccharide chain length determinant protein (PEP-CTERM system associated)